MNKTLTMSAKNKAFWKLPKQQQAVAIAKDVLKQLKEKFMVASTGEYFNVQNILEHIKNAPQKLDDTLSVIKQEGGRCSVCGIGSCFVSLVNIGNNVPTRGFLRGTIEEYDSIDDEKIRPLLRKVFSTTQLSLIESAFEKSWFSDDGSYTDEDCDLDEAVNFGKKYKTDNGRLTAIMNNIIKNKGTFIP